MSHRPSLQPLLVGAALKHLMLAPPHHPFMLICHMVDEAKPQFLMKVIYNYEINSYRTERNVNLCR